MDETTSHGKHCFASQRTCFEGPKVVVEHVQDVVDEFFGQAEGRVIICGGNFVKVDGHPNQRPDPPAKSLDKLRWWTLLLAGLKDPQRPDYAQSCLTI